MKADLVIRGQAPARSAHVARQLWAAGIYVPDAAALCESWGADFSRAWAECDRLDLVLPLALLRGARVEVVAGVALDWLLELRSALGSTVSGLVLAGELTTALLAELHAPDLDVAELTRRKLGYLTRAGQGAGYHVRTALAYVVGLHLQRLSAWATRACHEAHLVGLHVLLALDAELGARSEQLDLGLEQLAIDRQAYVERALERAKELVP